MVAASGRDHRVAVLVRVHLDVHDDRLVGLECLLDDAVHLLHLLRSEPDRVEGLGQLHEIGDCVQIGRRVPALVEEILPLAHHAVKVVVEDEDLDRQLVDDRGGHLLHVHLEAAVARDAEHQLVAEGRLRP